MSDSIIEAVSKETEPKKFEPSSETIDGFTVYRKKKDYVEIEKDGLTLGKIRGDITDQSITEQVERAKLKLQRQDLS